MKELAITLDTEKKQPLYEQIYEALREAILLIFIRNRIAVILPVMCGNYMI